jgi:hypothetical protein
MRLAQRGVVYPRCGVANLGHYGATLSIFTGIAEPFGIREQARGLYPTLFEYLRKHRDLPASEVWLATNNGLQAASFGYGQHRDYGSRYGASVIDGDGLFNEEFRELLGQLGEPRPDTEAERATLARLRGAVRTDPAAGSVGADVAAAKVEEYILAELGNDGTTRLTGPGAGDAKALNVAGRLLRLFRPAFLGVSLSNADVAHGSYNQYVDVIRRNDQELGRILDLVDADPDLAGSTSIFVLPEFGRDRDLNERNGLDHGDGSTDLQQVACIAAGPDFRRGVVEASEVRSIDVCPTILNLFDVRSPLVRGKVLPRLFA